jgi:hypothetical protein
VKQNKLLQLEGQLGIILNPSTQMVMNYKQLIMMSDVQNMPHGSLEIECEHVYSTVFRDGFCVIYQVTKNDQLYLCFSKNYQGDLNDYSVWLKYKWQC